MTNLTAYQGLPLSTFVALSNEDGSTYDYTLYTYDGEVRSYVDDALIATLSVTGATSNGENGVIIEATALVTAAINPGIYKYDILQTETATSITLPAFSGDFIMLNTRTTP